jgi:hypothetical protein
MTGLRDRWRKRGGVLVVLVAVALATVSCTGSAPPPIQGASGTGDGASAPAAPQTVELNSAEAVEKPIVAADGGVVQVRTDQISGAQVVFPQDALGSNETIVLTPYTAGPVAGDDVLVQGFQLEAKGGATGLALNHPAFVTFGVNEDLGKDAVIVRYNDDGTFEELPTKTAASGGKTLLTAITTHFSGTGVMKRGRAKKSRDAFEDFNWVVYIKDKQKAQNGPMKQTVTLTLRAVNKGGDIPGTYDGNATIRSTNEMNAGGGSAKATFTGKSSEVSIIVRDPTADLAPLTPSDPESIPLAPLTLPNYWSGAGKITMSAMAASGVGTVEAGGYSGSKAMQNTSSVPIDIKINGPQVTLTAHLPNSSMTFKGFIRGEGKK